MRITKIKHDHGAEFLVKDKDGEFNLCVRRSVANELAVNDSIEFIFIPDSRLKWDKVVLYLHKGKGNQQQILIGKNTYWHSYYAEKWPVAS
ncbi:hypothetical protein K8R32_01535 [bacterium]|nr:hypothetical protein [bacterium]